MTVTQQSCKLIGFSIHTLNTLQELLNQETSFNTFANDNKLSLTSNIFGKMFRIAGSSDIWINVTGNNNSIQDDWHIIESNTDSIALAVLRKTYHVDSTVELVIDIIPDVNKAGDDFLLLPRSKDHKCLKCGATGSDKIFYLTEWTLSTGASTDGVVYCESCILAHVTRH